MNRTTISQFVYIEWNEMYVLGGLAQKIAGIFSSIHNSIWNYQWGRKTVSVYFCRLFPFPSKCRFDQIEVVSTYE